MHVGCKQKQKLPVPVLGNLELSLMHKILQNLLSKQWQTHLVPEKNLGLHCLHFSFKLVKGDKMTGIISI